MNLPMMAIVSRPPVGWPPASPARDTITILGEFLTLTALLKLKNKLNISLDKKKEYL